MAHEWVFDVLSDLKDYALANGFPELAAKADEALEVARREVKDSGKLAAAKPEDRKAR